MEVFVLQTIRFWFTKTDTAAYISLLDLQRVMQRAFKRSKLSVWYTKGFNPHIYMTFAAPLALGQESLIESLEIKTEDENFNCETAPDAINPCLPSGIKVTKVCPVKRQASEISHAEYDIKYSAAMAKFAQKAFEKLELCKEANVQKKGKKGKIKTIDLKEHVEIVGQKTDENGALIVNVKLPGGVKININPMLLLEFLENEMDLPKNSAEIMRKALYVQSTELFE